METEEKKSVRVDFANGESLSDFVKSKLGFFNGLVKITLTHNSPYTIKFKPLKGTFSDNLIESIED